MKYKKWVWCLHCERCFEVYLSKQPSENDSLFDHAMDFELQFGVLHEKIEGQERQHGSGLMVWESGERVLREASPEDVEELLSSPVKGEKVFAICPYKDCDGDLKDFWWWDQYKSAKEDSSSSTPEAPEPKKVYSLY